METVSSYFVTFTKLVSLITHQWWTDW